MTEPQTSINGLRVALLALLPKDGTRLSVAHLAQATGASQPAVTNALFEPYMARQVNFDVRSDSYFAAPQGNDLSTERKST